MTVKVRGTRKGKTKKERKGNLDVSLELDHPVLDPKERLYLTVTVNNDKRYRYLTVIYLSNSITY